MDDEQRQCPRVLVILGIALLVVLVIVVRDYHPVCGEDAACAPAATC